MNKALLLIGKCLIAVGILLSAPMFYVIGPWFGYNIDISDITVEVLWPIVAAVTLGWALCIIANMKTPERNFTPVSLKETPIALFFKVVKCGFLCAAGFQLIAAFLVGCYYLFAHIEDTGPFICVLLVLIPLVYFGIVYFNKDKNKTD